MVKGARASGRADLVETSALAPQAAISIAAANHPKRRTFTPATVPTAHWLARDSPLIVSESPRDLLALNLTAADVVSCDSPIR